MQLIIIKNNKIRYFFLPAKVFGNYWITDEQNNNLVNIESSDNKWILRSNDEVKIMNKDMFLDSIFLINYSFCTLKKADESDPFLIYCCPTYDPTNVYLSVKDNTTLSIGKIPTNDIIYDAQNVASKHCSITYSNNTWSFNHGESPLSFKNKDLAMDEQLSCGDILFIMGLKIIIGTNFIVLNNPDNKMSYNTSILTEIKFDESEEQNPFDDEEDLYIDLYQPEDYFLRQPRFKSSIEQEEILIDPPPAKQDLQEMPLIYTIGPMITMAMTSMVTLVSTLTNVLMNGKKWTAAIPSIVIAVAMLCSVLIWPSMTRKYNRKQKKKREELRNTKYKAYLEEKKKVINEAIVKQRQIVIDNNISLQECINIINTRKRSLWEREIEDDDFLTVRIGIGSANPYLLIKAPEQHFSLEDDELNILVQTIVNNSKVMEGVPISISLTEKNIVAMVGQNEVNKVFIDGIILQLVTFHSYDDLKIVLFTKDENVKEWEYMKILPHCWDDGKNIRFFATNAEDMKQVSAYLEKIYYDRMFPEGNNKESDKDFRSHKPYYLIITDNLKVARNIEIVKKILGNKRNLGFSLIIKNERLANLPGECPTFLNIDQSGSGLFENELVSTKQKSFVADLDYNLNLLSVAKTLANVPLESRTAGANLPNLISFLQMYNIGKIEQLNSQNRWKTNDPTNSLIVPVGVDESGEPFNLDLHEKAHGPHGLIAGMTGSGKSEFIITYILSLAVNYHPHEVSFILIDYKGGGLAGAFENRETGIKLPHLAGTITNLDTMEMKRSLASIQSELRRRQKMFNEARDSLNESTIDIYKYQRLYRDGLVKTPISHLFIISDEFAELKAQQPDFMAQLIQTARIGRSLGVHLILATQKPAGVVDDQIWSNSKFRVCLKVQDKSDSVDMIKCADAAMLKNVGRFYLQVGYNEFFGLGQSAWAGAQYLPTDKVKKKVDNSISFINSIGEVIRSVDDSKKTLSIVSKGEELPNILKYLVNIAKTEEINVSQLWLDKIPEYIYVENLKQKYNYTPTKFNLMPIIGEFDDPDNQRQGLLTLPLTKDGNTIIYGVAGSGKEVLLTTVIYSLITDHSPEEVNLYIMDFGAETLKIFRNAPHVGEVLLSTETEKITNLLRMLQETIEERKNLFLDYNGDYNFYCQNSGNTVPMLVVIVNNYEVFSESYYEYEDEIQQISREGFKYGIIFIFTTNGTNSVKYRLRQNFKTELVLQMNDEGDYLTIYGNTGKVYPSNIKGRGIVKMESVYEFQTAYPYKETEMVEYLKLICSKLAQKYTYRAKNVPILPDKVTLNFVASSLNGLSNIPIGVQKSSLQIETIDLKNRYSTIITGTELESYKTFITSIVKQVYQVKESKLIVFDTLEIISKDCQSFGEYKSSGFDKLIELICTHIEESYDIYIQNNYDRTSLTGRERYTIFLIGIEELMKRINPIIKARFLESIEKGKDLELVNFVLIDSLDGLKKQEYENWYKAIVSTNRGIWLGNGIADQFTLKLAKTPRELRELIPEDFGYSVKNGIASLIKLISSDKE